MFLNLTILIFSNNLTTNDNSKYSMLELKCNIISQIRIFEGTIEFQICININYKYIN